MPRRKSAMPAKKKATREFTAMVHEAQKIHKAHPSGTWQNALKEAARKQQRARRK